MVTELVLIVLTVALVAWDIYLAIDDTRGNTISQVIWRTARRHPVLAFAIGVLCGHLLLPQ